MFDAVPYRLLVRRVRSGDCDKIGELYSLVEPDLTGFCQSLTDDAASARRAADNAFAYAAELLAAQSVTVAGFRSTLFAEAKGRCYSEIGRAAQSEITGSFPDDPARIDLDRLQARLEHLRPEALSSPTARLTLRSRLAPSTAISVVLVMVVMIEMAALGLDLVPRNPGRDDSGNPATKKTEPAATARRSVMQSPATRKKDAEPAGQRDSEKSRTLPTADPPADLKSRTEESNPRQESKEQNAPMTDDDLLSEVPVAEKVPALPAPEVSVEVDAGPIDVQVTPPGDSGILPAVSACVGSSCVASP